MRDWIGGQVFHRLQDFLDYFRQRNARYGAIASVSVLVFLGVLVALNYLSLKVLSPWKHRLDEHAETPPEPK